MNDVQIQPTSKEVAKRPLTNILLAVITSLTGFTLAIVGVLVFLGVVNLDVSSDLRDQNTYAACARKIAAEYEDGRDAFLRASSPEEVAQARSEFIEFTDGPGGVYENRQERTLRICGPTP